MKKLQLGILSVLSIILIGCSSENSENENPKNSENSEQDTKTVNPLNSISGNLRASVVAFYPFINGSLKDFSGNNQHLTNTTAIPSEDRNGNKNCAYEFDNLLKEKDVLKTSKTGALDKLEDFSIVLWYQALKDRGLGANEFLIQRAIGNGEDREDRQWAVKLHDCRRDVFVWTAAVWENSTDDLDCYAFAKSQRLKWNHLVCTFDSETNTMKLYKNGELHESTDKVYNKPQHIGDLLIGKSFAGRIDDVIILDKPVNDKGVKLLFSLDPICL